MIALAVCLVIPFLWAAGLMCFDVSMLAHVRSRLELRSAAAARAGADVLRRNQPDPDIGLAMQRAQNAADANPVPLATEVADDISSLQTRVTVVSQGIVKLYLIAPRVMAHRAVADLAPDPGSATGFRVALVE